MDIQYFKNKLEKELKLLEGELKSVGRVSPSNPDDWEAKPADIDIDPSDPNDQADVIEEFETNTGILKELEIRYNDVKNALTRIEDGTYGKCKMDGENIEEERLEANPAAMTCKEHINE